MMQQIRIENKVLFGLLLVHIVVLFFDFLNLPFSHDELSAIYRCRFTDFNHLIQQGIMPDGHPAGIQIWLWYNIQLFGTTEWILKLPFAIASIGCTYFIFKCSLKLFNLYAATLCTVIFVSLEFFLTQQTYVRPYTIGLLCNLGFLYFTLKNIENNVQFSNYIGIVFYSTLSYYIHYFSFLQSLVIWLSVFLVYYEKLNFKLFVGCFVVSLFLFLPHINITLHQLSMGGLGWLGKPDIHFLGSFYLSLFNGSLFFLIFSVLLSVIALYQFKNNNKKYCLLILLWLIPLVVLWLYSVFNAPVLQAAALYFSTPFLLILMGNSINYFKKNTIKIAIIFVVLVISFTSLVFSKHFYKQRYFSPIKAFINQSNIYLKNNPNDSVLILWQGNSNYFNFYNLKSSKPLKVIFADTCSVFNLSNFNTIICNELPPEKMHQGGQYFPYLYAKDFNFLYAFYVLKNEVNNSPLYKRVNSFQFTFSKNEEWSQSFNFNLFKEGITKNMFLELIPQLDSTINNAELVMEIYDKNERIDWRSIPLEPHKILSAKLKDIIKSDTINHTYSVKIFIWNKDKKNFPTLNATLKFRADNPYEYIGKWD